MVEFSNLEEILLFVGRYESQTVKETPKIIDDLIKTNQLLCRHLLEEQQEHWFLESEATLEMFYETALTLKKLHNDLHELTNSLALQVCDFQETKSLTLEDS